MDWTSLGTGVIVVVFLAAVLVIALRIR